MNTLVICCCEYEKENNQDRYIVLVYVYNIIYIIQNFIILIVDIIINM